MILQAKQVGVRGPNKENFIKKFYKQSKLGVGRRIQKNSVPLPFFVLCNLVNQSLMIVNRIIIIVLNNLAS
ncbi:hypothetical protein BSZ10_08020 [Staphylococcus aureus]|nr:hypothetical protein BSZ10_08020 [Staphylococcus aureus]